MTTLSAHYNGIGGKFGETRIQAVSNDKIRMAIYAAEEAAAGALTLPNFALKHPPKNQDPVWVQVLRHVELRPGVRSSAARVDRRL